jgi:hypothetical protein
MDKTSYYHPAKIPVCIAGILRRQVSFLAATYLPTFHLRYHFTRTILIFPLGLAHTREGHRASFST